MSSTAPIGAASYRPVPGPLDRDTFSAAQRRHRRAAAWLSLLAIAAMGLTGLPLAAILFPLLFGLASLASLPVSRLLHVPDLAGSLFAGHGIAGFDPTTPIEWLALGLVICLPGAVAMMWLGHRVSQRLTSSNLAAVCARLGARAARSDDAEERQLVNVAEEIAIAAGLPAPRVLLLDNPTINVAALGASPQDATLLVTRGLLDQCNRDETQALIADAVAAIGNGDLRATLRWVAVALSLAIVRLLLQAPYWPVARQQLAVLRPLLWRRGADDAAADDAAIAALLRDAPASVGDLAEPGTSLGGRIRFALSVPFFTAHAMFNAVAWFASLLFLSPALSLLLRRRRYLADAIAVQLTRYPDALASALSRVIRQTLVPRSMPRMLALLFVAAPPDLYADNEPATGFFFGTHPSPGKRHQRVTRMGLLAQQADTSQFAALLALPPRARLLVLALCAVLAPLFAALLGLMLYLIVALTGLSLTIGMIYVMLALLPIRWLFGA